MPIIEHFDIMIFIGAGIILQYERSMNPSFTNLRFQHTTQEIQIFNVGDRFCIRLIFVCDQVLTLKSSYNVALLIPHLPPDLCWFIIKNKTASTFSKFWKFHISYLQALARKTPNFFMIVNPTDHSLLDMFHQWLWSYQANTLILKYHFFVF